MIEIKGVKCYPLKIGYSFTINKHSCYANGLETVESLIEIYLDIYKDGEK